MSNISGDEYFARGCTALMDAIGKTIVTMDKTVPFNHKVIFVIMTDGLENASREYDRKKVKKLIESHPHWEFVFLGANIDSYQEGQSIGISKNKIANFNKNEKSVGMVFECAGKMCDGEVFDLQEEINK